MPHKVIYIRVSDELHAACLLASKQASSGSLQAYVLALLERDVLALLHNTQNSNSRASTIEQKPVLALSTAFDASTIAPLGASTIEPVGGSYPDNSSLSNKLEKVLPAQIEHGLFDDIVAGVWRPPT